MDKGGWKFLANNDDNNNVISVEYKSGIGNFAKFFNGGQPFVDDLVAVVGKKDDATTAVTIRSSSRVGDSDMGVNQKRLQFLAAQARSQGWQVPEPKY